MRRFAIAIGAITLLAVCSPASSARAQQPTPAGEIRGSVVAAGGAELGSSAVELYAADSSLVTGVLTDDRGRFRLIGVQAGNYRLRVTHIGYEPQVVNATLQPGGRITDVGVLQLTTSAVALDALEVTAEKAPVSLQVDRTVYHARQAAAAGGSATDVLRNVPGVEVDAEGAVSMRGNSNVAVQINGRAAPMRGEALTAFLKQLPASTLERVEVISNPSAKYDAEGMGGIINIVMRQGTSLGLSGGVNVAAGTGSKYNGSGNLGYQAGRLTLFANAGAHHDVRGNETYSFRESWFDSSPSFLEQNAIGDLRMDGMTFTGNADVRVGAHSTVSTALMVNRIAAALDNTNSYGSYDSDRTLVAQTFRSSDLAQDILNSDISLTFRRSVNPTNDLSMDFRFTRAGDDLSSHFFDGLPSDSVRYLFLARDVDTQADEFAIQTDVTREMGGITFQFGQKTSWRGLDNDEWVRNGSASAEESFRPFGYSQNVLAAYLLGTKTIGAATVQAGLRAERTSANFGIGGESTHEQAYTSLFPSASVQYVLSDNRTARFAYSRRIQRPQAEFLNPFTMSDDPLNQFSGNPALMPEHTDAIEFTVQQVGSRGTLQVQPFVRRTTDAIKVIKTVAADGMATTTFQNLESALSVGTDITGTARLGDALSGMLSLSGFRMATEAAPGSDLPTSETLTWNARANVNWTVRPGTAVQTMLHHRAPTNVEGGRIASFTVFTAALQQKVLGDRGTVGLRIMDPLNTMKMRFTTADAVHSQSAWRKLESRMAHLTFSYTFGQQPRIRQRAPQNQEDPLQIQIR